MVGVRGEGVVLRRDRRQHHADNLDLGAHRSDYVTLEKPRVDLVSQHNDLPRC